MAVGDFYVRRNAADITAVPNAGSGNEDAGWDTLVVDESSAGVFTYTDPNIQLDIGLYLIMYSEKFSTTNSTNNERIEIQGEIHVSGTGVVGGYGQDYIRKASAHQQCVVSGYMILDVTVNNTDIFTRFYRTDNSTTGTVVRDVDYGGIQILQLDSTHNYGFYSNAIATTITATTASFPLDTNDRQDTGFTRSGTSITITSAGRYLVTYSIDLSQTSGSRLEYNAYLRLNTNEIRGTRSATYLRGTDSCQDGALTWIGIIDVAASDALDLRVGATTAATANVPIGMTLQILQIPAAADEAIMEATNGNWNAAAEFTFDTLPFIDTASFTATAGTTTINVDQRDHLLVFGTFSQLAPDTVQRGSPELRVNRGGSTLVNHAAGNYYHRNSGGIGAAAATVACLVPSIATNESIEIRTDPAAATGAMNNDSAQFAILSLESLFGPYTYDPVITLVEDGKIGISEANNVITGEGFEASQGVGKVELVQFSDYTGTKVIQTINTWADLSVDFDAVQGALAEGQVYVFVSTNGGLRSNGFSVQLGRESYAAQITTLGAKHLWMLDNDYVDDIGTNDMNQGVVGTQAFVTTPLCRGTTYSVNFNDVLDAREAPDSTDMNLATQTQRCMSGWIQLGGIQKALGSIYKEGAQINNFAFLIGLGNVLMAQQADTADDNVQAYSDFKLAANRAYHIAFKMSYTETPREFRLLVDGILQSVTDGNPLLATNMDAHSGDIGWGDPDGTLEMGGTDISFAGQENILYAAWNSFNTLLTNVQIRQTLFEEGALPDQIISSDTEAAMQTALDVFADTERPDAPMAFQIAAVSGGASFELVANNITFNPRISLHLQFLGSGTLTWVNENGSNLDISLVTVPNVGTVVIVESVPVTITVKDIDDSSTLQNVRVRIEADTGGPLTAGTVILEGLTDVNGILSGNMRYSADQPITGIIRKSTTGTLYKETGISNTVGSSGLSQQLFMIKDI